MVAYLVFFNNSRYYGLCYKPLYVIRYIVYILWYMLYIYYHLSNLKVMTKSYETGECLNWEE